MQVREEVDTVFFPSRLAKVVGAEPAGQMKDEQLHAVVARSTFPSQDAQNTSALEQFWALRCTLFWHEAHFQVKSVRH